MSRMIRKIVSVTDAIKQARAIKNSICHITQGEGTVSAATGFLVSFDHGGQTIHGILTNHSDSVLPASDDARKAVFKFQYSDTAWKSDPPSDTTFYRDEGADLTFLPQDYFEIEASNEQASGGDRASRSESSDGISYYIQTPSGSSGSPVMQGSRLVGLHQSGTSQCNYGGYLSGFIQELESEMTKYNSKLLLTQEIVVPEVPGGSMLEQEHSYDSFGWADGFNSEDAKAIEEKWEEDELIEHAQIICDYEEIRYDNFDSNDAILMPEMAHEEYYRQTTEASYPGHPGSRPPSPITPPSPDSSSMETWGSSNEGELWPTILIE